jgi:opacity protein-like surface antigen
MKRILALILVAAMAVPSLNAQFTKVGGGLDFTSGYHFHNMNFNENKSGDLALSLKGIYKINVPIQISPSFTFLYPHVVKTSDIMSTSKTVVTTMMFDINGHYIFNALDKFEFYGLAGLDVLLGWKKYTYKYQGSPTTTSKESDNAFGLNLGAGSYMKITDQFNAFLEAKYIFSKYHQAMINAGVLINIDWLIKHEATAVN